MWGAQPRVASATSLAFVAPAALDDGLAERLQLRRRLVGVADTRAVAKADLPGNDATPDIRVDADTFAVRIDGELVQEQPVTSLPLAQRYRLF